MKNRVILLVIVFLGIRVATQAARAANPVLGAPASRKEPGQNFLGPRLGGDLWEAPAATVNPDFLIPDDSAIPVLSDEFTGHHFETTFGRDSFLLADAFKSDVMQVENVKPMEKIEVRSEDSLYDQPAAVAPPRRGETKRILLIALAGLAILVFRKFRAQGSVPRQKPSFL